MEEASSSLVALVALFDTDLARVNFPDVSGASLRDAAESVEQQRLAVAEAEAALRSARDALEQSRSSYEKLGRRALAYARVYAEGDADLEARLGAIARGLDGTKAEVATDAPRRRGRPRKTDASLFEVDAPARTPSRLSGATPDDAHDDAQEEDAHDDAQEELLAASA